MEDVEIERVIGKWERAGQLLYRVVGAILLVAFILFLLSLCALLVWYMPT